MSTTYAIYEECRPPVDLGYADLAVPVRVNPTKAQWQAWIDGTNWRSDETPEERTAREVKLLHALHSLYGSRPIAPGLDFTTPEKARQTYDNPDVPDEVWYWLLDLPWAVVAKRRATILKNGSGSLVSPR